MKRILLLISIPYFFAVSMEDEVKDLRRIHEKNRAELAQMQRENEAKWQRRAELIQTHMAGRQKVLSKFIELYKAKGGNFICFLEEVLLKTQSDVCLDLIRWYLKENERNPSFTHEDRVELALYCMLKSIIRHRDLEKELMSAFEMQSRAIIKDLSEDKSFDDKAQPQLLTLICLPHTPYKLSNGTLLELSAPAPQLARFLTERTTVDALAHCIMQLIAFNEKAALDFFVFENTQLNREFFMSYYKLFCIWSDLFNRPHLLSWLMRWRREASEGGPQPDDLSTECACENSQETSHVLLSFERAAYLGSVEALTSIKDIKRIRVRNLGWNFNTWNFKPCLDLLDVAAINGYSKLAQFCIERGLEVTQYHVLTAMDYGHAEVLKLLLSHFEGEIDDVDYQFRFVEMGYLDAVECVKCVIGKMDLKQLLFWAFHVFAGVPTVELLLNEIEKVDGERRTELFRYGLLLAIDTDLDILKCFTSRSVVLNGFLKDFTDCDSSNPLHLAVYNLLLDARAVIRRQPQQSAAQGEHDDQGPEDQDEIQVEPSEKENEQDAINNQDLQKRKRADELVVIAFLLEHGAQDEPDEKGRTALSYLQEALEKLNLHGKIAKKSRVLVKRVIKMLTQHAAKESKAHEGAREEKFSEGLVHYTVHDDSKESSDNFDDINSDPMV